MGYISPPSFCAVPLSSYHLCVCACENKERREKSEIFRNGFVPFSVFFIDLKAQMKNLQGDNGI